MAIVLGFISSLLVHQPCVSADELVNFHQAFRDIQACFEEPTHFRGYSALTVIVPVPKNAPCWVFDIELDAAREQRDILADYLAKFTTMETSVCQGADASLDIVNALRPHELLDYVDMAREEFGSKEPVFLDCGEPPCIAFVHAPGGSNRWAASFAWQKLLTHGTVYAASLTGDWWMLAVLPVAHQTSSFDSRESKVDRMRPRVLYRACRRWNQYLSTHPDVVREEPKIGETDISPEAWEGFGTHLRRLRQRSSVPSSTLH